jgi:LysM repeat protein
LSYSNNCSNTFPKVVQQEKKAGEHDERSYISIQVGSIQQAWKTSVNQGFQVNPSGGLTRRGRLARTIVVLSLAVVMVAGFAATSGANVAGSTSAASSEPSYSVVVVAPGETLWSVAAAYATGDVQGLINEIREVNNLKGYDLQAGQRLRVPLGQLIHAQLGHDTPLSKF